MTASDPLKTNRNPNHSMWSHVVQCFWHSN